VVSCNPYTGRRPAYDLNFRQRYQPDNNNVLIGEAGFARQSNMECRWPVGRRSIPSRILPQPLPMPIPEIRLFNVRKVSGEPKSMEDKYARHQ
jgi:hypothetical protein